VPGRTRLSVHRVRERRFGVLDLIQAQAPLEANGPGSTAHRPAVGAAEHHMPGAAADAGPIDDLASGRSVHSAMLTAPSPPLLTPCPGIEQAATVAGALRGDDLSLRWHGLQVSKAEVHRALHQAAPTQPPG
jgi:hypothetical protein